MSRRAGFSLFELAIVMVIVAFIAGGALTFVISMATRAQYDETNRRMDILQKALLDYSRANDRLPCPADAAQLPEAAAYGVGAQNASTPFDCTAENFSNGNTVEGMVPVKTLGLPDAMGLDAWGRRILYAVDQRLVVPYALTTYPRGDATVGSLTVEADTAGTSRTTAAVYVLYSAGVNGHGAFPAGGGASRLSVGSTDADELDNCDCDASGNFTALNSRFVQKQVTVNALTNAETFDDVVRYSIRADLRGGT